MPDKPEVWEELSTLRKEVELMGGKCTSLDELLVKFQPMIYLNVHLRPEGIPRLIQIHYIDGKWRVGNFIAHTDSSRPESWDTLDEAVIEFWRLWRELHGEQER